MEISAVFPAQDEDQQTAFLRLTKEDDVTAIGFKKTVFKALEPRRTISKIKTKMSEILPISSGSLSRQEKK